MILSVLVDQDSERLDEERKSVLIIQIEIHQREADVIQDGGHSGFVDTGSPLGLPPVRRRGTGALEDFCPRSDRLRRSEK